MIPRDIRRPQSGRASNDNYWCPGFFAFNSASSSGSRFTRVDWPRPWNDFLHAHCVLVMSITLRLFNNVWTVLLSQRTTTNGLRLSYTELTRLYVLLQVGQWVLRCYPLKQVMHLINMALHFNAGVLDTAHTLHSPTLVLMATVLGVHALIQVFLYLSIYNFEFCAMFS